MHVSPASVATTLKRMEKSGFILRAEDKDDTRKKRLTATEKGSDALRSFRKVCEETDGQLFKNFSEEEKETILRPYRIAKRCGCKFYCGSDAHTPSEFEGYKEIMERAVIK